MPISPLGRYVDRVDGRLKVTGQAEYSADYQPSVQTSLEHACVVTSTIAVGTIRTMDTRAAKDAPGVVAVFSPMPGDEHLTLRVAPGDRGENYVPLQDNRVRFHGQIIAMVLAETYEQAREAAALITTTYDEQTPRTSLAAGSPGQPVIGQNGAPVAPTTILAPGVDSIEAALAASHTVVEATYSQPVQNHVGMEPHATLAVWSDGKLTVHHGSQFAPLHALSISGRVGIPPESVRVISRYVGGGFGSRFPIWSDAILASAAAWHRKRAVKLVLTREQVFTVVGHRAHLNQTIRLGATRAGDLTVVSHESDAEKSAAGGLPPMLPAQDTSAVLYKTPNMYISQREVVLDLPAVRAMRGPSESPGSFAIETAMDELAVALEMDPVDLRMRNYATVVPGSNLPWSSKHLDDCYRIGAQRFGWSRRKAKPRSRVEGQWLYGMGMASAIYPLNPSPAGARIRLRDDDSAVVSTSTSDLGTGALTMLAIVGAELLGLPLNQVKPELGDTALPQGAPAVGSGATASTIPAIQAAVRDAVTALKDVAVSNRRSPWYGLDAAELDYQDGRLRAGKRSMTFGRLLRTVGLPNVEATFQPPAVDPTQPAPRPTFRSYTFGAHFCEVRVNRLTCETRVTRFTTVADVGRVINAKAFRSQLLGGVIFGIGHALLESNPINLATGRFEAANLGEYLVPVNADIPAIDVHWLDRPDPRVGGSGIGARGPGEITAVGSAAAVGNAIYNATGVRARDVPITLDKLLE